jgi:hypothetical protein
MLGTVGTFNVQLSTYQRSAAIGGSDDLGQSFTDETLLCASLLLR